MVLVHELISSTHELNFSTPEHPCPNPKVKQLRLTQIAHRSLRQLCGGGAVMDESRSKLMMNKESIVGGLSSLRRCNSFSLTLLSLSRRLPVRKGRNPSNPSQQTPLAHIRCLSHAVPCPMPFT